MSNYCSKDNDALNHENNKFIIADKRVKTIHKKKISHKSQTFRYSCSLLLKSKGQDLEVEWKDQDLGDSKQGPAWHCVF